MRALSIVVVCLAGVLLSGCFEGKQGATGPAGPQGAVGAAGPTGSQGQVGAAGPIGPAGPQGVPGPKGEKGDKGDKGADGAAGKSAAALTVVRSNAGEAMVCPAGEDIVSVTCSGGASAISKNDSGRWAGQCNGSSGANVALCMKP